MKLLTGDNENVARWVAARIPFVGDKGFGRCTAIGVVDKNNVPMAGVVFHDWQEQFGTLSFSIAADSPRWVTRRLIGQILTYPFDYIGVNKLWTVTPSSNERALRLAKGLGFKREAMLHQHFGKDDAVVNRMFAKEYRRLYGGINGQTERSDAA